MGPDVTVMVAAVLSTEPALLEMRTQYVVVCVIAGVMKLALLVPTGALVSSAAPRYHR